MTNSGPVTLFLSYAREDERWLRKLETHLSLLQRQGLISLWHDRRITPGIDWTKAINTHLETASVILLLVSADFLASDYCYGVEMKRALERQETGEAQVIPILLRSVNWKGASFAHLEALPTNAKPITAWSDEDAALTDVTAGIRRVIDKLPLLPTSAPSAALPRIWNVPYARNPYFTGREDVLRTLYDTLRVDKTAALTQPQAISGLGGIGKTQSAVEYAYRYHHDYQAVLWVQAETRELLISDFVVVAGLLNLPDKDMRDQNQAIEAVKHWLKEHRDWMLILDNADDLAMVREFVPPAFGGHILLTTRAQAMGRLARRIELEKMGPEEGASFLLHRAGILAESDILEKASADERNQAREISQEMDGLPLALDQAGAYIEETGCRLADYLNIYKLRRKELLKRRGGLVLDHPEPVATTWSLSFEKIKLANPAAADLMCLCAFLNPDHIPEESIARGAPDLGPLLRVIATDLLKLNEAIEKLREFSLIRRDPDTKTLSIHRLVQAVLKESMTADIQRQWRVRIEKALDRAFIAGSDEYLVSPFEFYSDYVPACAERWMKNCTIITHLDLKELFSQDLAQDIAIKMSLELQRSHPRSLRLKTWINQAVAVGGSRLLEGLNIQDE